LQLLPERFFQHSFLEGRIVADKGKISDESQEFFPDSVKAGGAS